jgi:hypothetical protein
MRQNSIDENVFHCFNGYNKVISDINANKRLLMNRRQGDKPSIIMLKKEHSVDRATRQPLTSENSNLVQLSVNNYCDTKNGHQAQLHRSTHHMFPPKVKTSYLNSKVSRRQVRPNTANFFKLKQPFNVNRNTSMQRNDNHQHSPNYSKTAQSISKRHTGVRVSKDYKQVLGSSFGNDSINPKKFTINDLAGT